MMGSLRISFEHKCPGCQSKNNLVTEKPQMFKPRYAEYKCGGCESFLTLKVSKDMDKGATKFKIITRIIALKASPLLVKMREEEKEHLAKPLEIE